MENKLSSTVITVASSKGGVGKSTVCICLAGAFATHGRSVHVLDLDDTQTVSRWHRQHVAVLPNITAEAVSPQDFGVRYKLAAATADLILIDVAGAYEKTMLQAMARSSLVIVPAQPSEPDLHEATKVVRDLADLNESFSGAVPCRLLLNQIDPLDPMYQRHAMAEVVRLGLPRFETALGRRAPYREVFMTGQVPHAADRTREPVRKAVAEIDALLAEITAILHPTTHQEAA